MKSLSTCQIESFVTSYEKGSFSNAAKALNKGRTTISEQVKYLEINLGVELFERNKRNPLQLTEEGIKILFQAKLILDLTNKIFENCQSIYNNEEKSITVSIDPIIPKYMVSSIFNTISKKFPHTSINLSNQETDDIYDNINKNSLTLAIVISKREKKLIPPKGIEGIFICDLPVKFYARTDSHLHSKQVSKYELMLEPLYLLKGFNSEAFWANNYNITKYTVSDTELLIDIIQQQGWTILPACYALHEKYNGLIQEVKTKFINIDPSISILAIYKESQIGPVKYELIETIKSTFNNLFTSRC